MRPKFADFGEATDKEAHPWRKRYKASNLDGKLALIGQMYRACRPVVVIECASGLDADAIKALVSTPT